MLRQNIIVRHVDLIKLLLNQVVRYGLLQHLLHLGTIVVDMYLDLLDPLNDDVLENLLSV